MGGESCCQGFAERVVADEEVVLLAHFPPGFRALLAAELGEAYDLSDARQLPTQLRSERWEQLCKALDDWPRLVREQKIRLAVLLHSLCIYDAVLALIDAQDDSELVFWRASAKFMSGLPEKTSEYVDADMSVFEALTVAADEPATRFNATAMVFVHKAKTGASPDVLAQWHEKYESALAGVTPAVDQFSAALYASRFYRGSAFLPQRLGQRTEVGRVLDLAERHATRETPRTSAEHHLHLENLHALMESRTKEALWLGDTALALAKANKVVEVDPNDAKAWMELGEVRFHRKEWRQAAEAYATAAVLGIPASAAGRHMAGFCLRMAGDTRLAALLFKDALELDPLGISPIHHIHKLPVDGVLDAQDMDRFHAAPLAPQRQLALQG
jgi:tetratricopeptide (TPR) repeat protein